MKPFTLILILAHLFLNHLYGQHCSDDIFEIEVYNSSKDNFEIIYWDKNIDKFKSPGCANLAGTRS